MCRAVLRDGGLRHRPVLCDHPEQRVGHDQLDETAVVGVDDRLRGRDTCRLACALEKRIT